MALQADSRSKQVKNAHKPHYMQTTEELQKTGENWSFQVNTGQKQVTRRPETGAAQVKKLAKTGHQPINPTIYKPARAVRIAVCYNGAGLNVAWEHTLTFAPGCRGCIPAGGFCSECRCSR